MSTIVAGNFATKTEADRAIEALRSGGIAADHICEFALNPPGQHAAYPIGGDEDASHGATAAGGDALKGAALGSAIGLGAGVAALPVAGPAGLVAGAGIGAYVGSLAGALHGMGDAPSAAEKADAGDADQAAATPPAGVLVAVLAPAPAQRGLAANVMHLGGARNVQEADGTWSDGRWVDFDPVPGAHTAEPNRH